MRYQVRKDILALLVQKEYRPGDKLPSEQELSDFLNVSRASLREGLHLLEEDHLIRTQHGTGRYLIATPKDYKFDITRLQSVTEMLADYGLDVTNRVLSASENPADPQLAATMSLAPGTPVICVERARYAENVPVIYSLDYMPSARLDAAFDFCHYEGSLFKLLDERWGVYPEYTRTTIRSVISKKMVPPSVVSDPTVPWILLEQVNYDSQGEVVIYSKDFHHGEYVTFHLLRYRR